MQQLFIGDISLSDGTIESVVLVEGEVRVEFRIWDGGKAWFRFAGVIGSRDRNAAGQDVESIEMQPIPAIRAAGFDPFVTELLEERRADRTAPIVRYAFIGSWTMRPILEIYAEEVDAQRMSFL